MGLVALEREKLSAVMDVSLVHLFALESLSEKFAVVHVDLVVTGILVLDNRLEERMLLEGLGWASSCAVLLLNGHEGLFRQIAFSKAIPLGVVLQVTSLLTGFEDWEELEVLVLRIQRYYLLVGHGGC